MITFFENFLESDDLSIIDSVVCEILSQYLDDDLTLTFKAIPGMQIDGFAEDRGNGQIVIGIAEDLQREGGELYYRTLIHELVHARQFFDNSFNYSINYPYHGKPWEREAWHEESEIYTRLFE